MLLSKHNGSKKTSATNIVKLENAQLLSLQHARDLLVCHHAYLLQNQFVTGITKKQSESAILWIMVLIKVTLNSTKTLPLTCGVTSPLYIWLKKEDIASKLMELQSLTMYRCKRLKHGPSQKVSQSKMDLVAQHGHKMSSTSRNKVSLSKSSCIEPT
jgi:hypothetical protein